MGMENEKQRRTEKKERIVKNVGIWRRNEPLGRDSRKKRAEFVVRIRVY